MHEALDQIGAVLGPLIVSGVLYFKGGYRTGFCYAAYTGIHGNKRAHDSPMVIPSTTQSGSGSAGIGDEGISQKFWLYLAAVALIAAGYADFPLIAYHFKKVSTVSDTWIPVFYAVAMGVDAIAALLFGYLFDRKGISILIIVSLFSMLFAPLVF